MNLHRFAVAALLPAASLFAQETEPAALPAAGSPAATALVDQALEKMLAYGRGTFRTSEAQDNAMMRGAGVPFGREDTEVDGGWHQDLVWGDVDGHQFLRNNGRMVAKTDAGWRLRGQKLGSGRPAPFTLDPALLFTALRSLPPQARKVEHVEAGEVAGKKVLILSLVLESEIATDFVESGAVPGVGGAGGGMFMFGGPPGMEMASPDQTAHLALFVDPDGGDLVRVGVKVFEKNPMAGQLTIMVAGGGGDDDDDEQEEVAEAEATPTGPLVWKKGFPQRKPAKDESVMTFRVDFKQLGLAEPPAVDDKVKALLRLR